MKIPFLIGERVYLRPLELEDAATFVPWFNDLEVTRFLRQGPPVTLASEREFIERLSRDANGLALGIALRADDRLIGSAGLHLMDLRNRSSGFGISIGEKTEWGRGYGTEATALILRHAFQSLNLHRVWLHVHAFNPRAIRCYEKLGFRLEGTLRDEVFRDGTYQDTLVMGILEHEWRERAAGTPRGDES